MTARFAFVRIVIIVIVLAGMIISARIVFEHERGDERWTNDFVRVTNRSIVHGKIKEVYCPPTIRCTGAVFVILEDDSKHYIRLTYADFGPLLGEIIAVGDSISKPRDKDSISVFVGPKREMFRFALFYLKE